jgi:uncharacterized protein (DUF2062 family)
VWMTTAAQLQALYFEARCVGSQLFWLLAANRCSALTLSQTFGSAVAPFAALQLLQCIPLGFVLHRSQVQPASVTIHVHAKPHTCPSIIHHVTPVQLGVCRCVKQPART